MAVIAGLPAVALIEDAASWRWASGAVAIALLVVMVAAAVIVPASTPHMRASKGQKRAGSRQVIAHRSTAWLLAVMVLLFVSYFGWVTYFGAYFEHDFEGTAGRLGTLFLVGGLSELAANSFVPWLTRRFSVFALTLTGSIGLSATLLGSGSVFATSASLFVSISLLHIFTSFMYIGANTLLLDSQPGNYGPVMAMTSAATGFGGATGALIAGVALAQFDSYEAAYVLLGVLMTLSIGFLMLSRRASSQPTSPS
jgi:predicted MFS family arabinose efflux permease